MKKLLFFLLSICLTSTMMAQKGMSSVGLNIPVDIRKHNVSIGIGAKYQYNFTDYFRMEAAASYSPVNMSSKYTEIEYAYVQWNEIEKAHVVLQGSIAGHFFFVAPKPVRPYAVLGVGFAYLKTEFMHHHTYYNSQNYILEHKNRNRSAIRPMVGLGVDIRLDYKWLLQISGMVVKPIFLGKLGEGFTRNEVQGMANLSIMYNL